MAVETTAEQILAAIKNLIPTVPLLKDCVLELVKFEELETWNNWIDLVPVELDYNDQLIVWDYVVLLGLSHDNDVISEGESIVRQIAEEYEGDEHAIGFGITSGINAHGCNPVFAYVAIRDKNSRATKPISKTLVAAREYAKQLESVCKRLNNVSLQYAPVISKAEQFANSDWRWNLYGSGLDAYEVVTTLSTGRYDPRDKLVLLVQNNFFPPDISAGVEVKTGVCYCGLTESYHIFWAFRKSNLDGRHKEESEFENDFHKCLVSDIPLYEAFESMACKRVPADSRERYQRLRSTGFVMQDEADIDVYTQHVAQRHIPKFKWLYANLFRKYRSIFSAPIDLVVWGCGCGLDLIALYDQAMKEGNPNFWLVVRSITLVDISSAALGRAESIAKILFPTAEVKKMRKDLKNQSDMSGIRLDVGFPYVPRVHLLSNILDLYDDVSPFAKSLIHLSARHIQVPPSTKSSVFFNELFVAFSPDYKRGDVRRNMVNFRNAWGNLGDDVALEGDAPLNCEYAVFECNSLKRSLAYQKFSCGNVFLRRMVRDAQHDQSEGIKIAMMRELVKVRVGEHSFVDAYGFSEGFEYSVYEADDGSEKKVRVVHRAIFCLSIPGRKFRPCIILCDGVKSEKCRREAIRTFLRKFENYISDLHLKQLLGDLRAVSDRIWQNAHREDGKEISVEDIDCQIEAESLPVLQKISGYVSLLLFDVRSGRMISVEDDSTELIAISAEDGILDFTSYYVVIPGNIATLPPLSSEQREIADGRRQLRKVKGGPGVGKTVTMLWHALRVVQRSHLPVLILCKTVSLINYNQRRLIATYLAENPGQQGIDKNLFRFMTIDAFLCSYVKRSRQCILQRCSDCQKECKRKKVLNYPTKYLKTKEDWDRHTKILNRFDCDKCSRSTGCKEVCRILGCKGLDENDVREHRKIPDKTLSEECRKCKIELVRKLKRRDRGRRWEDEIGAVLVDEAQILDPEYVQSVYNLTELANKWREFYLFCDAQQAFRHNSLEQDGTTKKWDVKAPRTGEKGKYFGSFCVLKENFRLKSRSLIEACRIVQGKLRGKDEELTLFNWATMGRNEDVGTGAFGIRAVRTVDFPFVEAEVSFLHDNCGAESVTVICEEQGMARRLARPAIEKEWITTHLPIESYTDEKRLRQEFYEHPGCNHLTSVDCAQGQSFEAVIFILSSNREQFAEGLMEQVFTALSRSGRFLRVLDASSSHWLYALLTGVQ